MNADALPFFGKFFFKLAVDGFAASNQGGKQTAKTYGAVDDYGKKHSIDEGYVEDMEKEQS